MSRMSTEIGRVLGGRYRIIAPIGMGASAQVFLADDSKLRRRVAVKMLHDALAHDPDFLRRFRAEAQAAASLGHANVVAVYDWGDDDSAFIVTEFLAGGSVRAMLDHGPRLTPAQAAVVGLEAASGLDYAHRRGFVHRDIKPANLLFGDDGRLRIADFGLARALAEAAWTEPQGAMLGTARYASPEQAQGKQLTVRSDVYSLALVIVEAVTGDVPFSADTTLGTLMARVDQPLVVPESLGPLRSILERAGNPDPGERIDARELVSGLTDAAAILGEAGPLPLAGALDAKVMDEVEGDATIHGVPAEQAPAQANDPVVDLRDDDRGIDPPQWVSGGGGRQAPARSEPVVATHLPAGRVPVTDGEGRRRRWPWVLLLMVAIGVAGAVAFLTMRGGSAAPTHAVPQLRGQNEVAARAVARRFTWRFAAGGGREDGSTPGEIIRTSPPAGEHLAEGKQLTVVISDGNTLVTVPNGLVGTSRAEAEAALTGAGLKAQTQPRVDETAPAGQVLALGDGTSGRLPKASTVSLVVSSGPAPRPVPANLVGAAEAQARALLADAQLTAGPNSRGYSDTVPPGRVMAASPAPGTPLARGSAVTLVISQGPELVGVPRVTSAGTIGAAIAILQQAGLAPGNVSGPATGRPRSTSPAAGQRVKRGSRVNIILG